MSTLQTQQQKGHKLVYSISAALGVLFLLLSIAAYVFEMLHPQWRGTLAWSFMLKSVGSFALAGWCYNRYLHALRMRAEPSMPRTFRRTNSACGSVPNLRFVDINIAFQRCTVHSATKL